MEEPFRKSFNTPVFPRFLPSMVAIVATALIAFNVLHLRQSLINSLIEIGMAACFIALQILVIRNTAWKVDIWNEGIAGFYFPKRRVEIHWEQIGQVREEIGVSLFPRSDKPTLILQSRDGMREIGISKYISHYDELTRLIRERLRNRKGQHEPTS